MGSPFSLYQSLGFTCSLKKSSVLLYSKWAWERLGRQIPLRIMTTESLRKSLNCVVFRNASHEEKKLTTFLCTVSRSCGKPFLPRKWKGKLGRICRKLDLQWLIELRKGNWRRRESKSELMKGRKMASLKRNWASWFWTVFYWLCPVERLFSVTKSTFESLIMSFVYIS